MANARVVLEQLQQQNDGVRFRLRKSLRIEASNADGWRITIGGMGRGLPNIEVARKGADVDSQQHVLQPKFGSDDSSQPADSYLLFAHQRVPCPKTLCRPLKQRIHDT